MARLALAYGGAAVGALAGWWLGPAGSMVGVQLGSALGYGAGSVAGGLLFPEHQAKQNGPRLNDRNVQVSVWGLEIPECYGAYRFAGNMVWATPLVETSTSSSGSGGGKGGALKGESSTATTYTYFGNFAVAFCRGPITKFNKIWADGRLIYGPGAAGKYDSYFTFYLGTETQLPNATMEADKGVGQVPAHRGLAYFVAALLPLEDFGNRIPQFTAEIIQSDGLTATYDSEFDWHESLPIVGMSYPQYSQFNDGLDSFGVMHVETLGGTQIAGIDSTGAVTYTLTLADVATAVNAWVTATTIVPVPLLNIPNDVYLDNLNVNVICNGSKIAVHFQANANTPATFRHWITIWSVGAGSPVLQGAVWYYSLTDIPYGSNLRIFHGGTRLTSDPMFGWGNYSIGAWETAFVVLPSPAEIIAATYAAGYPGQAHALQIPLYRIHLGTSSDVAAHYERFLLTGAGTNGGNTGGSENYSSRNGWMLPAVDTSGGTPAYVSHFYMYFGKAAAAYIAAHHGGTNEYSTQFYNQVIAPNPGGCLVRWNFGLRTFPQWITAIAAVSTGNRDWFLGAANEVGSSMVDSTGASVVPFSDEGFRWDGVASVYGDTQNRYQATPTIKALPSGAWLVGFVGTASSTGVEAAGPDYFAYMHVRAFVYNPSTVKYTQQGTVRGIGYASSDQGSNPSSGGAGGWDDNQKLLQISGTSLYVWGIIGPSITGGGGTDSGAHAYRTRLGFLDDSGGIGLDAIVASVCERCGLSTGQIDVSGLATQRVAGYLIGTDATGRSALEPLQACWFFDGVETDGTLTFRFRDGVPVDTVPLADLGATGSGGDNPLRMMETRAQDIDLPSRVTVKYADKSIDYQQSSQHDRRSSLAIRAGDPVVLDLPIVLTAAQAKQTAQRSLYLAWLHRTSRSFALPPRYLAYDPTDTISVIYENDAGSTTQATIYLTKAELGANGVVKCEGVGTDAVVYVDSPAAGSVITGAQTTVSTVDAAVVAELIDGPLLRDVDDTFGYYAAALPSTTGWKGGALYASADGGTTYSSVVSLSLGAPVGTAGTVLAAPAAFEIIDTASSVSVTLPAGFTLASVTDAELLAGANAGLVGNELVYWGTATQTGAHTWTLTRFLRGRQGTDWAMASHGAAERFVLLATDGTIVPVTTAAGEVGAARHYKAVSTGGAIADAPDETATLRSNRLKPLSPIAIEGSRDGSNNLTITWTRRARKSTAWTDLVDSAPLDEPVEAYQIDILSGMTVLRTLTSSTAAVSYSAADQTTDGLTPGDPVDVQIFQMSTRVGRGYAGSATV